MEKKNQNLLRSVSNKQDGVARAATVKDEDLLSQRTRLFTKTSKAYTLNEKIKSKNSESLKLSLARGSHYQSSGGNSLSQRIYLREVRYDSKQATSSGQMIFPPIEENNNDN